MRRVVALIRDDGGPPELHPQPDLADLEKLVAEMDVPTTLRIEGEAQPLSAGVALSTFRIVQEALTNVRRHSQAGSVAVTLRYLPDSLEIEVADDGVGGSRRVRWQRPDRDARAGPDVRRDGGHEDRPGAGLPRPCRAPDGGSGMTRVSWSTTRSWCAPASR